MIATNKRITSETKRIEKFLRREFPTAECYRYSPGVIRIRVVDPRFAGKTVTERQNMLRPLIHQLPEETQLDITMLVLLTEDEKARSAVNLEYEEPSPFGL